MKALIPLKGVLKIVQVYPGKTFVFYFQLLSVVRAWKRFLETTFEVTNCDFKEDVGLKRTVSFSPH